jgi:hypothetical protein
LYARRDGAGTTNRSRLNLAACLQLVLAVGYDYFVGCHTAADGSYIVLRKGNRYRPYLNRLV